MLCFVLGAHIFLLCSVLERLTDESREGSDLRIQIEVYEEEAQYDKEELADRFEQLDCDVNDIDSVLKGEKKEDFFWFVFRLLKQVVQCSRIGRAATCWKRAFWGCVRAC